MLELSEVFKKHRHIAGNRKLSRVDGVKYKGLTFISGKIYTSERMAFTCEHCKQLFMDFSFKLSIFLYGAIILYKKNNSYLGFTCPNCMNPILINEGNFHGYLFNIFSSEKYFNFSDFRLSMYYFTSIYNYKLIDRFHPDLRDYNFNCFNSGHHDSIYDSIGYFEDENNMSNHLCSFIKSETIPTSEEISVLYVDESKVEELIKVERERNISLIPRYIHKNRLIEKIEEFCLRYGFADPLARTVESEKSNIDYLNEVAKKNSWDVNELNDSDPDTIRLEALESIFEENRKYQDIDFSATSNFMNILVADPLPWDLLEPNYSWISKLWKQPYPFKSQKLPSNVSILRKLYQDDKTADDLKEYKLVSDKRERIITEIKKVFSKSYVQKFLSEQYPHFIKEYSAIVNRYAFSYADVWQLKERYLEEVYECIQDKKSTRPSYRHKVACRKIAKEIWSKNPEVTIADMILCDDISNACDNHVYDEKVLRSWINYLCPDRSPGRRSPKNQIR